MTQKIARTLTVLLVCKDVSCSSFGRKVAYPLAKDRLCDGCGGRLHGWGDAGEAVPIKAPQLTRQAPDLDAWLQPEPAAPATTDLTPAQVAHEVLTALAAGPLEARACLAAVCRQLGRDQLLVNRRPFKLAQLRQLAARLAREGKVAVYGDTLALGILS